MGAKKERGMNAAAAFKEGQCADSRRAAAVSESAVVSESAAV